MLCIQVSCLEEHRREPGTPRIFALKETIETGVGCVGCTFAPWVHCWGLELVDSGPWQGFGVVGEHGYLFPIHLPWVVQSQAHTHTPRALCHKASVCTPDTCV